jgi:Rhamnan synthesis protein F/Glycosyl transferase family 2
VQIAVVAHVYYPDLWPEIAAYLRKWPSKDFLLYITTAEDRIERVKSTVGDEFDAVFISAANRGKDIGQFLNCLPSIRAGIICKVHTKKSAWAYGEAWRKDLYRGTLGISPESVLAAFEREPTLGILAPGGHLLPHRVWWERNVQLVTRLAGEIGATDNLLPFRFPAGAMFWARAAALAPLLKLSLRLSDFEEESGQTDGTLSHAIERLFPIAARLAGYETMDTGSLPMLTKVLDEHLSVPWWAGNGNLQIAETDAVDTKRRPPRVQSNLRAVAAQQKAAQLEGDLRAAEANAVAAQQKAAQLESDLRAAETNAAQLEAAQRDLARLQGNLEAVAADREAAQKRSEKLELESKAAIGHMEQVNQTLGDRLVVAEGRAAAAEAWRAAILASSSWRLSQRIRFLLGDKPGGLKRLLRRSPKLLLWTVTLQLPARWRLWRQASTEAALPFALAPPIGATTGPDTAAKAAPNTAPDNTPDTTLASAFQRVKVLENRAATIESALEMETGRIDWALGSIEGVTAQIGAYHAYRETEQYRAAYTSTTPLVSVCVATMDRASLLLERSIASIRAQSYRNLQIVVVGDNCTDDTALRLAALSDSRIQFANLPERGPYPRPGIDRWHVAGSNAMNHALSLCEGQFLTHLDDDDAMVPHRIETLIAEALQHQADFLWHAFWYENRDGTWMRLGNGRFQLAQVSTGSIFYHRYFAQFPWDVRAYRLREPGDWNRLRKIKLLRPRMRFVDEPLLYHHIEQSQATFVAQDGERFLE